MNKIQMLLMCTGLIFSSASSCSKERNESPDDKITLEKIEFNSEKLKIDGYYYQKDPSRPQIHIFFLYKNGVILEGNVVKLEDIIEKEEEFRNGSYAAHASKYKYNWGLFQTNGSQIKYEKWAPSEGPLRTFTYNGVILNDTTFVINQSYRMQNGKITNLKEINVEYHFKEFAPKPDSTNPFIP